MNNITLYNKDCLECISQLETNSIDFIYFNPPYGTTECNYDKALNWENLWPEIWRVLKPKGVVAIHASIPFTYKLASTQNKHLKYNWYWDKMCCPTGHLFASRQPMRMIEEVLIFYKKLGTYNPQMILKDKPLTILEHNNKNTFITFNYLNPLIFISLTRSLFYLYHFQYIFYLNFYKLMHFDHHCKSNLILYHFH